MIATETQAKIGLELFDLDAIWQSIKLLGLPAAIWKLPNQSIVKLIVSINTEIKSIDPELEKLTTGFVFSPFHWKDNQMVNFIQGDILMDFSLQGNCIKQEINVDENHPTIISIINGAKELHQQNIPKPKSAIKIKVLPQNTEAKTRFQKNVKLAIQAIRNGEFQKVVIARTNKLHFGKEFQPIKAFQKLTLTYELAFVSLLNLPDVAENWLGASPELLIQAGNAGTFKTMSLAGTQTAFNKKGELISKKDIRWGQKEIEEQALVSRYIVECFKKIRLREYQETGPKTVLAGNLYHLRTDFQVDTNQVNFRELGSTMVKLLHPTSAICGTPKIEALNFIREMEGFDRSLYSGFLGPIQVDGQTNIYVNLRTVRFKGDIATFYAGAGITEDSNPLREWEETELKCNTLLQVIASDLQ